MVHYQNAETQKPKFFVPATLDPIMLEILLHKGGILPQGENNASSDLDLMSDS